MMWGRLRSDVAVAFAVGPNSCQLEPNVWDECRLSIWKIQLTMEGRRGPRVRYQTIWAIVNNTARRHRRGGGQMQNSGCKTQLMGTYFGSILSIMAIRCCVQFQMGSPPPYECEGGRGGIWRGYEWPRNGNIIRISTAAMPRNYISKNNKI